MGIKISIRDVGSMQPHSILWDSIVHGFNARRQFSETITFSVTYRTKGGQQKWYKLGRWPILTPHLARQEP